VSRLKFWKRNRNQVNQKSNIDYEIEVNKELRIDCTTEVNKELIIDCDTKIIDTNHNTIQSNDQQSDVALQRRTTLEQIARKPNIVKITIFGDNIETEDEVFYFNRKPVEKWLLRSQNIENQSDDKEIKSFLIENFDKLTEKESLIMRIRPNIDQESTDKVPDFEVFMRKFWTRYSLSLNTNSEDNNIEETQISITKDNPFYKLEQELDFSLDSIHTKEFEQFDEHLENRCLAFRYYLSLFWLRDTPFLTFLGQDERLDQYLFCLRNSFRIPFENQNQLMIESKNDALNYRYFCAIQVIEVEDRNQNCIDIDNKVDIEIMGQKINALINEKIVIEVNRNQFSNDNSFKVRIHSKNTINNYLSRLEQPITICRFQINVGQNQLIIGVRFELFNDEESYSKNLINPLVVANYFSTFLLNISGIYSYYENQLNTLFKVLSQSSDIEVKKIVIESIGDLFDQTDNNSMDLLVKTYVDLSLLEDIPRNRDFLKNFLLFESFFDHLVKIEFLRRIPEYLKNSKQSLDVKRRLLEVLIEMENECNATQIKEYFLPILTSIMTTTHNKVLFTNSLKLFVRFLGKYFYAI